MTQNQPKLLIITESTECLNFKKHFPTYPARYCVCGGHIYQMKKQDGVNWKTLSPITEIIPKSKDSKFKNSKSKKELIKQINEDADWADYVVVAADDDLSGAFINFCIIDCIKPKNRHKCIVKAMTAWDKDSIQRKILNNSSPEKLDVPYNHNVSWLEDYSKYGCPMWTAYAECFRMTLDQILGFSTSNFVRNKTGGRSSGRVISPVLLLLLENKRAIEGYVKKPSFGLNYIIHTNSPKQDLSIDLIKLNPNFKTNDEMFYGEEDDKSSDIIKFIKQEDINNYVKTYLNKNEFLLESKDKKETFKNAPIPFATMDFNKYISARFGWKIKEINEILEHLYREGKTSYPRSSSVKIDKEMCKDIINYLKSQKNVNIEDINIQSNTDNYYFNKIERRDAEGHFCLSPAKFSTATEPSKLEQEIKDSCKGAKTKLNPEHVFKVYEILWERCKLVFFKPSKSENYTLTFDNNNSKFVGKFSNMIYLGWRKYTDDFNEDEEKDISLSAEPYILKNKYQASNFGKISTLREYINKKPSQASWPSILKIMTQKNLGRASTIKGLSVRLEDYNYVTEKGKYIYLTDLGLKVALEIEKSLSDVINLHFTAELQKNIDAISMGKDIYYKEMLNFLKVLNQDLTKNGLPEWNEENTKSKDKGVLSKPILTNLTCPKCGKPLKKVEGKFGTFYSCSNYPKCDYSQKSDKQVKTYKCPKCGKTMIDFEWTDKKTGKKRISRKCLNSKCKYVEWEPK